MIDPNDLAWTKVDAVSYKAYERGERLRCIRHSCAHLMAAVIERRLPGTRFATGPATGTGFFYDMVPEGAALRLEDLPEIEAEMAALAAQDLPFEVAEIDAAEARDYFAAQGQSFKVEIMDRIDSPTVTLYRLGEFVDLCAGSHVPSTRMLGNFRLTNVSGAHWRSETEPSLTRVTGTAWSSPKDLTRYLKILEEIRRRDHRVRGPELDLFIFHPWAASALWHPNGLVLRDELDRLWRERRGEYGYISILNPLLYRPELFQCSGHWEHFQEDMFVFDNEKGEPAYALKPMNCPDTMLFFKSRTRSYRDLPLRVAESQVLHRNEASGAIHGIMRTRNFVQDDAHIFLDEHHVQDEVAAQLRLIRDTYAVFDLESRLHLSTRPEHFLGNLAVWNTAEDALRRALEVNRQPYVVDENEGAFYGPKIDVYVTDSLGRDWQCGTVQLDFNLPERFELEFTAEDGERRRPIVIHRAVYGSVERFLGILIEHFDGLFPTWLAPEQAVVLPISQEFGGYAREVRARMQAAGIRCDIDEEDSLNYRIRAAEKRRVRYLLVVGERERTAGTIAVRLSGAGRRFTAPIDAIVTEIAEKTRTRELDVEVQNLFEEFTDTAAQTGNRDY